LILLICGIAKGQDMPFKNVMSRTQLESYLSRSMAAEFDSLHRGMKEYYDLINFAAKYDARYLGQCRYMGYVNALPINYGFFDSVAAIVHDIDSVYAMNGLLRPIVEGAIFESIPKDVDSIWINADVTAAYGVAPRPFNYDSMKYIGDTTEVGNITPDMARTETQMYFYFLATQYLRAGIEALHMGQILLEDTTDTMHVATWDLNNKIRTFAKNYNRGLVLITADNLGLYLNKSDTAIYDFNSSPARVTGYYSGNDSTWNSMWDYFESKYGGPGVLEYTSCSPYGKMKGGLCYFGWYADTLPYMVKMDNTLTNNCNCLSRGGCWNVYGFDESSWFVLQTEDYRNQWLCYAYNRVKQLDPNANYRLPGRTLFTLHWDWYFAANGYGYDQEDEIAAIWNGTAGNCDPNDVTDIKALWDKGSNLGDFFVLAYPNPASGIVNIIYNGPKEDNISIKIANEEGQPIWSCNITDNKNGGYIQWDAQGVLPGIYFCFATDVTGRTTASKITILR